MIILNKSYVMHLNNYFVNSVNATTESDRHKRLINHSRGSSGCFTQQWLFHIMRLFHLENEIPRLIALTSRNIEQDEE